MKTIYNKLLFLLLLLPFSVLAQSTIDGVVVDSKTRQPISGVNVVVQGTQAGTSTDIDGKFKLSKLKAGDKVVFSFVGYKNQTINFENQKSLTVSLEEEANLLQEVVVQIGYGNVKKKDATGSVAALGAKDFNKGPVTTAENLLSGRLAGVTVNTSGAPGSGSEIRIRGGSSLNASNDPLIVIDGLPVSNEGGAGSTSILAALNPNDIESFTVLKDASSSAIYGSRASNGVIIITTKRGGKKLTVDYNFQYGSGKNVKQINVFGADEFRSIVQQQRPGLAGLLGTSNTDWQKEIYRRTDYVDNNLSIKGNLFGTIPARVSIGNTYQEGLRLTNSFNRNTVSTTLNHSFLKDHLKFRLNATFANENNRFADGVEGSAIHFDPTQPVYQAGSPFGGYFEYYNPSNGNLNLAPRNPVAQLMQTYNTGKSNRIFGNFETDYKFHFFPELRAVVNVGFDQSNGVNTRLVDAGVATGGNYTDGAGVVHYIGTDATQTSVLRNKLIDTYLAYNKKFGKLNVEATLGRSYQVFNIERTFYGDLRRNPATPPNATYYRPQTDNVLIGYFLRTNLTFNDKYLLTASLRRDGSSRLAKENQWKYYPAFAFAWKLKNDLFKDSKTVSDFKLRLGYGITGNQGLDAVYNNIYLQQYALGGVNSQYTFGSTPTPIGISRPYNDILKWETQTTYNAGFDYGLFNNRITGAIDVFYKKTNDLFAVAPVADGGNFSNSLLQNIGSFTTKGVEFSINAEVVKSADFNWNVNFNATKFERRITSLAGGADVYFGGTGAGTGGTAQIYREGFTPGSFYVYKQLYDTAGRPIEGAYADLNGDGIINGSDRYIYKNPDPDFVFGFSSNMNYKHLDFSFNLRANVGNRVYNAVNSGNAQYDNLQNSTALGNIPTAVQNTGFNTTSNVVLSDIYVENGSFLRMDNITLGYTFPKWLEGKASLRLFSGVQNAFIITKYSGLDPEITGGIDNTIYPRQRSFLFGANVKF
jgi:TonB-linked SusC/RagA family outer membrane protein